MKYFEETFIFTTAVTVAFNRLCLQRHLKIASLAFACLLAVLNNTVSFNKNVVNKDLVNWITYNQNNILAKTTLNNHFEHTLL